MVLRAKGKHLLVESVVEVHRLPPSLSSLSSRYTSYPGRNFKAKSCRQYASDDDRFVDDRQLVFAERLDHRALRSPSDKVFRFVRGFSLLLHVNQEHWSRMFAISNRYLFNPADARLTEQRFMCSGGTGGTMTD